MARFNKQQRQELEDKLESELSSKYAIIVDF